MEVFDTVRKTLFAIISDAADSDNYLEKLTTIEGLIKPEAAATSFQLMERGKVRKLALPSSEIRLKSRIFDDFQEKTVFDWKSEWILRKPKKRRTSEIYQQPERSFIEVEHAKRKESLQFFYPRVHYCPCRFFQNSVLEKQTDWICVHLLAYYFSKSFGKMERIECKKEIIGILRKILTRSVVIEDVDK